MTMQDAIPTVDDKQALERLGKLSCCDISDAMDRLRIPGQCFGIASLGTGMEMVGKAWTLRYGPVGEHPGTVGDYIDDLEAPWVVVLDNQGRLDVTVWGDILTSVASTKGISGTVIDGVCRDVDRARELGYSVFSRGNYMRTGKDRVQVESVGEPVSIGGVRVCRGDWIRGDGDGVVAIPAERLAEVLDAAEEIVAAESRIRADLESGMTLREAREKNSYHALQTART